MSQTHSLASLLRSSAPLHAKMVLLELARRPGVRAVADLQDALGGSQWVSLDELKAALRVLARAGEVMQPTPDVASLVVGSPWVGVLSRQGDDALARQARLVDVAAEAGFTAQEATDLFALVKTSRIAKGALLAWMANGDSGPAPALEISPTPNAVHVVEGDGDGLGGMKSKDAIAHVRGLSDVGELEALLEAELSGQARATVKTAIRTRLAELAESK